MEDYVVWHLTHKAQVSQSLATRTLAFDIRKLTWDQTMLQTAGIDEGLLSVPVPGGSSAGRKLI